MLINKSILTSVVLSMFLVTACVKEDLSEAGGNVHENFDLLWKPLTIIIATWSIKTSIGTRLEMNTVLSCMQI